MSCAEKYPQVIASAGRNPDFSVSKAHSSRHYQAENICVHSTQHDSEIAFVDWINGMM